MIHMVQNKPTVPMNGISLNTVTAITKYTLGLHYRKTQEYMVLLLSSKCITATAQCYIIISVLDIKHGGECGHWL